MGAPVMNLFAQPGLDPLLRVLLLFPIFWCCVVASISFIGGWHALAKRFRAEEKIFRIAESDDGKRFRCASMTMGPRYFPTNYGNCLTIRVSREGIRIKVWPMFRIFHPPLLIPWPDIESCEREKLLFFSRTAVYLNGRRHAMRFSGAAGQEIFSAWWQRFGPKSSAVRADS
jgi:hypothetical protein